MVIISTVNIMPLDIVDRAIYAAEDVQNFFDRPAKEVFESLSGKAKDFATDVFEHVEKMQIGDRILGRLKITYNQFWVDKHDEKANLIKDGINKVGGRISELDEKSVEITSSMQELSGRGVITPSLQKRLNAIEKEKIRLEFDKEKKQARYNARVEKKTTFIEKRNAIADKLIEYYDGRLEPIENKISKLQLSADVMELDLKVDEIKHKDSVAKLDEIEEIKKRLETKAGVSRKDIREIERHLKTGRKAAEKEQKDVFDLRLEIIEQKERIQQIDEKKAEPYRTKREQFEKIKEQNAANPPNREALKQRDEARYIQGVKDLEEKVMPEAIETSSKQKLWDLDNLVENWNRELTNLNGVNARDIIKPRQLKQFLRITDFPEDSRMTTANFKDVYLEYKRVLWRYKYKTGLILDAE
ncbi:hypothetical protein KKC62_01350 [Patescibacteria group bacterium]|nr:hypothetical protein [Patescibacteria group bacterium]MBU1952844.1 hypothetical protein [Patescibacteria group bacterium]